MSPLLIHKYFFLNHLLGNHTQESSFDIARKRQKQEGAQGGSLKVSKEMGRSALHGSKSSVKPSTWHTLGARAERNKENNAIPSKWTSNKIPQRAFGRAAPPSPPCIELFVDEEECSDCVHHNFLTVC